MMTVYIIAAEPSGDLVGAELMRGLTAATAGGVRFEGIGGPAMAEQGLISLFDYSELTLLGVFEVLPKAAHVLKRVKETVTHVQVTEPDLVLTVDAWGFTGRVLKALTRQGASMPRVRAVAPQVWAWRPGRAKQLSQWVDHLLTLFAFEPPLFEKQGLTSTWIGHPVAFSHLDRGDGAAFRQRNGLAANQFVLGVFPGSRKREVKTLLSEFAQAVKCLSDFNPVSVIPVVPSVQAQVEQGTQVWPGKVILVEQSEKADALAAMNGALAASGTVTLELALARVPHIIAYRVNWLTGQVLKRIASAKYANMVNIMLDREVVPECLMENCRAEVIAAALRSVVTDAEKLEAQISAFAQVRGQLSRDARAPGDWAASTLLELVNARSR